jgi:hypothetical protein
MSGRHLVILNNISLEDQARPGSEYRKKTESQTPAKSKEWLAAILQANKARKS